MILNDEALVIHANAGADAHYDPDRWHEIQELTAERGKSQRGVPRAKDPAKYPLPCRVVDLSDDGGSLMYGRTSAKRRLYTCGRCTSRGECNNNSVDAEALLRVVVLSLQQHLNQLGQTDRVRELLAERAQAGGDIQETSSQLEIRLLERRLSELCEDHELVGRRMCRERDEERQLRYQAEFDQIAKDLRATESALAEKRREAAKSTMSPREGTDAAMARFANLLRILDDPSARTHLKEHWLGLEFGAAVKSKKREIGRLQGGLLVFGERSLPIPIHGRA